MFRSHCVLGILLLSLFFSVLFGCKKVSEEENCSAIQQVTIAAEKNSFYVGDEIYLRAKFDDLSFSAYYSWTHTNRVNNISTSPEVHIHSAEKADEGWFYMQVSYPGCAVLIDSVYVSVKNKPAVSPCNPTNNAVTFSTIPDIAPATVTWSYDDGWKRRVLEAYSDWIYPDFKIYFNTFWDAKEPEDGEYNIVGMAATNEYPPYTVYISSLYSGIFLQAGSGKVYVSHVNNKLRVTFCNITLSGYSGGPVKTTATGALTAP
ncbi:hypothetical protein [Niastella populi]|uniref:Uncharacterized protein n=1 Tax=Niastella populi TaxID=550983 RepID=A0A1V9GD04_9BACT|nr:hypothetical protein [Niastella populi]OQP68417.1 hypothetical protein A4R26_01000 [Niastella populi]